jgi:hypothetical protein
VATDDGEPRSTPLAESESITSVTTLCRVHAPMLTVLRHPACLREQQIMFGGIRTRNREFHSADQADAAHRLDTVE